MLLASECMDTYNLIFHSSRCIDDISTRDPSHLVRKFLSDGELNTAWNREKIVMSQGFARYWVTLI